jgi:hypothetical protein
LRLGLAGEPVRPPCGAFGTTMCPTPGKQTNQLLLLVDAAQSLVVQSTDVLELDRHVYSW